MARLIRQIKIKIKLFAIIIEMRIYINKYLKKKLINK